MFHVGQKVVCVSTGPMAPWTQTAASALREGAIYEIRELGLHPWEPWHERGLMVWLAGIVVADAHRPWLWPDLPFSARRFRPLVERKTDISIFTDMLESDPMELVR